MPQTPAQAFCVANGLSKNVFIRRCPNGVRVNISDRVVNSNNVFWPRPAIVTRDRSHRLFVQSRDRADSTRAQEKSRARFSGTASQIFFSGEDLTRFVAELRRGSCTPNQSRLRMPVRGCSPHY